MDNDERIVSRRALRMLKSPRNFVKYVLVRADVSGFSVTPARVEDIARAIAGVPPSSVVQQGIDPLVYYRDLFASFLAQDPESYKAFQRFWDDLWYVELRGGSKGSSKSGSSLDKLVDSIVDDIYRKMTGGVYSLPPEVIEE